MGAGLALLLICRGAFWLVLPNATDDAYITFRYARHLAEGHGLVFNIGERVMGFTSLPWTLWCSLGILLVHDPLPWTRVSAVLLDGVTLYCLASVLEDDAGRAAAWCFAVYYAAWPFFSAIAASGLEMSAMVALMALAVYAAKRSPWWSGLALGTLSLMRPEGVIAAAVLALWAPARARWVALACFLGGLGFLALYFGNPLPQGMLAKASLYGTPGPLQARYWWEWLLPADLGQVPSQQETIQLWSLRVIMVPAACAGLWHLRRARGLGFGAAGLAVLGAYLLPGVAYFYWYFTVPAAAVAYLAAGGMPRVLRGPLVYASIALLVVGSWTVAPERSYRARARAEGRLFGDVAGFLAEHARPGDSVFLEPLGLVGWANPTLQIKDEVGLVAPEVTLRRTQGAGWYADLVNSHRPGWLVVRFDFLMGNHSFTGAAAPFRDTTDAQRCFAPYEVAFQTSSPPSTTDLIVLRRRI